MVLLGKVDDTDNLEDDSECTLPASLDDSKIITKDENKSVEVAPPTIVPQDNQQYFKPVIKRKCQEEADYQGNLKEADNQGNLKVNLLELQHQNMMEEHKLKMQCLEMKMKVYQQEFKAGVAKEQFYKSLHQLLHENGGAQNKSLISGITYASLLNLLMF